jgi:hypothetical protein
MRERHKGSLGLVLIILAIIVLVIVVLTFGAQLVRHVMDTVHNYSN